MLEQHKRAHPNNLQLQGKSPYTQYYHCKNHGWIAHELALRDKRNRPLCPECYKCMRTHRHPCSRASYLPEQINTVIVVDGREP